MVLVAATGICAGSSTAAGRPLVAECAVPDGSSDMITRLALDDPALKLSGAQKKQIDKLVDGYIAEQAKLREKYPMTPGSPPSQEMMTAMRSSRENLNTAVGKVLNDCAAHHLGSDDGGASSAGWWSGGARAVRRQRADHH